MKLKLMATVIVICFSAWRASSQEFGFQDFSNGQVLLSPCVTGSLYQIEWAPRLTSPSWSADSPFVPFQATSTVMRMDAPMFYRATHLAFTGQVHGVLYSGTSPVTKHPIHIGPVNEANPLSTNYYATVYTGGYGEYVFTNIRAGTHWLIVDTPPPGNGSGFEHGVRRVTVTTHDVREDFFVANVFQSTSPSNGSTVATNRPTFSWDNVGVPGVIYSIDLFDTNMNRIAFAKTDIPYHKFTNILARGSTYIWMLTAYLPAPWDDLPPLSRGTYLRYPAQELYELWHSDFTISNL